MPAGGGGQGQIGESTLARVGIALFATRITLLSGILHCSGREHNAYVFLCLEIIEPRCGVYRRGEGTAYDPSCHAVHVGFVMQHTAGASLDAQAAAFAHLLGLAPTDLDGAYRQAVSLGDGLFPHQIEGVAFLLGRRRAILADDMGLGKTRQAIVSLRHASPGGPYLVVCPASVKRNWAREIEQA